jgi:hypothetical protein
VFDGAKIIDLMTAGRVLLVVDDGELHARYEMILRFSGYEPVAVSGRTPLECLPTDVIAACVLTDHKAGAEAICATLLADAIPIVRIDPFIRHLREHLPFDVVLPTSSEPRQLITALRHLIPTRMHFS